MAISRKRLEKYQKSSKRWQKQNHGKKTEETKFESSKITLKILNCERLFGYEYETKTYASIKMLN